MPQTESKSSTGAVVRCEVLPVPPALRVSLRRVSTLAFRRTHAASEDAAQHNPPPKPHAFARGRRRYGQRQRVAAPRTQDLHRNLWVKLRQRSARLCAGFYN